MEVNKDEAEKCLKLGAEALRRGDNARAVKFLNKSLKLYPLPGAEALLSQALRKPSTERESSTSSSASRQTNGVNGSRSFESADSTNNAPATATGSNGREYTEEQAEIVKQLLRAKGGGRGAHYRVLGLEQNCSENDIKKAYRKLSLKVHPDKNSAPQADEAFKAVGLAYATLSDKQKRAVYDRYGDEDPDNVGGGRGMGRRGGVHMHGQEVSPEEIFNMFFGGGPGGMAGGMGPGFHVYSGGFGGPGVHFQANPPRRRARAGPQGQQHESREGAGLQMIFQLLPILMIFLVSFFRMGDQASSYPTGVNQYFSLKYQPPFINPLHTKLSAVEGIPYYVSDKFMRTYHRDRYQLAQVERMVERAYEQFLVDECDGQVRYKKSLQQRASQEKDPAERQKKKQIADKFDLERCGELDDLFPNRKNKNRKSGSRP
ncbi:hypothetical protein ACA910_017264 [Epithemia clementina (nom. ined.)]